MTPRRFLAASLLMTLAIGRLEAQTSRDRFDHEEHRKLFPSCQSCHAGAAVEGQSLWPQSTGCATCHDGTIQKAVNWGPPPSRPTLLRFTHGEHARTVSARSTADSSLACVSCHAPEGARWMQVSRGELERCLSCHGITAAHLEAPDSACATCHRSLPEAPALSRERIAAFPTPPSHEAAGFETKGHGREARLPASDTHHAGVATSCATCHAREFCTQCHVNAPETPTIQALASDPRSLAIAAKLKSPAGHGTDRFQRRHGGQSRAASATCATCHTQESCVSCHRSNPAIAAALPRSSPSRGIGAVVHRQKPATHDNGFTEGHGLLASATPGSCSACHARSECLDCHRPNAGGANGYHQAGFLSRHPSAAYNRQSDCSECHNSASFCTTCHAQSGLSSSQGLLQGKYHDAGGTFLLSHGAAARRGLESCVTCHTERDCLVCHSAQTRRFNPHGPGFDAERLRKKNPQTCAACHGRAIPGG
ncbi:MAG: cytochrome c3 family protein [Gemmatimonadota bacterium]|nr:cytochrome c3 family protein [Gemmatimonadota bacterium]